MVFWLITNASPSSGEITGGAYTSRVARASFRGVAAAREEAARTAVAREVMNCIMKDKREGPRDRRDKATVEMMRVRGEGREDSKHGELGGVCI